MDIAIPKQQQSNPHSRGHNASHGDANGHRHHCHHHHDHDNNESNDPFAHRSHEYDTLEHEAHARTVATAMVEKLDLRRDMQIMDFGCGTGLLTHFLAPYVGKILAVDPSAAMLQQFQSKSFDCTVTTLHGDFVHDDSALQQQRFDGVVSSMVLHHVLDLETLFAKLSTWIVPGGFLALADLDSENGMFHDPEHQEGVHHHGLDRVELAKMAGQHGFVDMTFYNVDAIRKATGDFPVFLMTAKRMEV